MPITEKSKKNLKPIKNSELARSLQEKSAEKRKQNNLEKMIFKEAIAQRMNVEDFNEIIDNLIKRAKYNDKSLETLRDTFGQKPKEQIESKQDINITMDSNLDNWGK